MAAPLSAASKKARLAKAFLRGSPVHCTWQLSPRCEALCHLCEHRGQSSGDELDTAGCQRVAEELFDTGVNMGPTVAATFLQRALTALNRNGKDYADLTPDGRVGEVTLRALDAFLAVRGQRTGETVLLRALEALQGERYLRLAERRPANEAFLYGWLANRIGNP